MYLLKDKPHHLSQIGEKVNDLQNKCIYLKSNKPIWRILKKLTFFEE